MIYRHTDKVSKWGRESAAAGELSRYSKSNRQLRGFTAFALWLSPPRLPRRAVGRAVGAECFPNKLVRVPKFTGK